MLLAAVSDILSTLGFDANDRYHGRGDDGP